MAVFMSKFFFLFVGYKNSLSHFRIPLSSIFSPLAGHKLKPQILEFRLADHSVPHFFALLIQKEDGKFRIQLLQREKTEGLVVSPQNYLDVFPDVLPVKIDNDYLYRHSFFGKRLTTF